MPTSPSESDIAAANANARTQLSRRKFLGFAGAATGVLIGAPACNKIKDYFPKPGGDGSVDLGSGDIGILNYAYALEQLEAAFYTRVIMSTYSGMTSREKMLLTDIRDHEIAHREFFKKALGAKAIPALKVNFAAVDFGSRNSVLTTAKTFEDLGVSAYNGAGRLITNPDYLVLAGKIVSVEARHAAYIRDLISNGSFADGTVVDANGLDKSRKPVEVLAMAKAFIETRINASNLPTS